MTTSVSSSGDGRTQGLNAPALLADNPSLKFASSERGYTRHVVTRGSWHAEYRVVERVTERATPVVSRKSFVIEAGRPGLLEA